MPSGANVPRKPLVPPRIGGPAAGSSRVGDVSRGFLLLDFAPEGMRSAPRSFMSSALRIAAEFGEPGGMRRSAKSRRRRARRFTAARTPRAAPGDIRTSAHTARLRDAFRARKEKPRSRSCGVLDKDPGDDLLSHARCTLPSARARFTSEFGMGSGGSTQLLSPGRGWRVAVHLEWSRHALARLLPAGSYPAFGE